MNNNCIIPIVFSLFHTETIADNFLNKSSTNNLVIYLQEFIKYKILNKNCTPEDFNICKQICAKLGVVNDNILSNYLLMYKIFNIEGIEMSNETPIKIITIKPKSDKHTTSIKKMLTYWQNEREINITNIPQFICLNIVKDKKIYVDIQKKIKLNTNNSWGFYSALCKSNDHYYVLLFRDDIWFVYNKDNNNSSYEVKMNDAYLVNNIKQDCVFVIYKII